MSRIAKNPIKISNDVQCTFKEGIFSAKGKLGEMNININSNYSINIKEDEIKKLKEKYDSLKFSNIIYNQSDKKLAKKKIRKMIDEIDNCILNLMG